MVWTGDKEAGVPRYAAGEPRLLEARDGAGDTRDRSDVRRGTVHDEDGDGIELRPQGHSCTLSVRGPLTTKRRSLVVILKKYYILNKLHERTIP